MGVDHHHKSKSALIDSVLKSARFGIASYAPIYDQKEEITDFEIMYTGPFTSDFYRKLHTVLHKEYRAGKIWRALRSGTGHQTPASRARGAASMLYNLATLPIERRKLEMLARRPNPSPLALPRILSPEAAATPSAQAE